MAATPEPSPLTRRSFSLPVARSSSSSDSQIEVLYTLNSARIVDFTALGPQARPGSSNGVPSVEDEVGKWSWVSPRERTIAIGPLRIYRAPGSVAFLNCANALRPILPKSQVWCVDGDSKFVLQVRRPQYWRIEVSNKSEEERSKVDELKKVFEDILLFEKTPCPFQRDFEVALPEAPTTTITKRPWKPVQGPRPQTPTGQDTAIEFGYGSPTFARRASSASPLRQSLLSNSRRNSELDLGSRFTSDGTHRPHATTSTPPGEINGSIAEAEELDYVLNHPCSTEDGSGLEQAMGDQAENVLGLSHSVTSEIVPEDDSDGSEATDKTPQARGRWSRDLSHLSTSQAIENNVVTHVEKTSTLPPSLSIVTSAENLTTMTKSLRSAISDSESLSSSIDSWHSLSPTDSEPSSPTQSFSFANDELTIPKRSESIKDRNTNTEPRTWDIGTTPAVEVDRSDLSIPSEPHTPTLTHDGSERSEDDRSEIMTPPAMTTRLRHRATTSSNSRRRQLSPLPAAVNLFSPASRRPLHKARHLPTAIIQKTYEILLSPPSHLFQLMINIASKIAAGEWRGVLLGQGEAVHWDLEDEYSGQSWQEDDYGVQLQGQSFKAKAHSNSWEVD